MMDSEGLSRVANALGKVSGGAVKPQSGTANDLSEKQQNIDSYRQATSEPIRPATGTRPMPTSNADRNNPGARYGSRMGEKRIDTSDMTKPLPGQTMRSYEDGTDEVPEDGPAMLHKGEAVLNKDDAKDMRESKGTNRVSKTLGGAPKKDKKKLTAKKGVTKKAHKIVARKATNGGVILEHHFDSGKPELHHHPDVDSALDQIKEHMSDGEGAEAGVQSMPQGGGAPGAPAAAAPGAPQPGMAQPSSFKDGGTVEKSGMAMVHKGEKVTPAPAAKKDSAPKEIQPSVDEDDKAKPMNKASVVWGGDKPAETASVVWGGKNKPA